MSLSVSLSHFSLSRGFKCIFSLSQSLFDDYAKGREMYLLDLLMKREVCEMKGTIKMK